MLQAVHEQQLGQHQPNGLPDIYTQCRSVNTQDRVGHRMHGKQTAQCISKLRPRSSNLLEGISVECLGKAHFIGQAQHRDRVDPGHDMVLLQKCKLGQETDRVKREMSRMPVSSRSRNGVGRDLHCEASAKSHGGPGAGRMHRIYRISRVPGSGSNIGR